MSCVIPEDQSFITYPCLFPIKAMGVNVPDLAQRLVALVQEHDPEFNPATVEMRSSKKGNYIGLTFVVNAKSRAQLDAIYRALTSHELVKYVL